MATELKLGPKEKETQISPGDQVLLSIICLLVTVGGLFGAGFAIQRIETSHQELKERVQRLERHEDARVR